MLLEGKDVTLWDELTEHKAVSQKAFFQLLTEDSSFFTIALYLLHNITLLILQEQSLRKASWGESCNRWGVLTEHTAVSQKASFQFLTEDISFYTIDPYGLQNITLQIPQEQS